MLDDALETDRVFGVGVRVNEKGLFPYATAGLIRSSVLSKDGTSQVILRGLQRVQITGIRQVEPYVIAEVTPVRPVAGGGEEVEGWKKKVLKLLERRAKGAPGVLDPLLRLVREEAAAERLCDLLAFHLVTFPEVLQKLLAEEDTRKRMAILLEGLRLSL
ncbi:MAG: hypothetical protein RLZZ244_906 [Verrucomicrobiota bacterium]